MRWSSVQDKVKWRKVISKFNDPNLPRSLPVSVGDWVYVDKISNDSENSPWYYGFKCGSSKICGIFPAICTELPSDECLPDIFAEVLSFLPMAQQIFTTGDRRIFQKATAYLHEISLLCNNQSKSFNQSDRSFLMRDALEFLSVCERYIGFPLQIRLPNALNSTSVKLYNEYLKKEKESKDRERPRRDLFNVRIEFEKYPPHTITMYLAAQAMRLPDTLINGGTPEDAHAVNINNHLVEFLRGNDDGAVFSSISSSPQFSEFCRISENAVVESKLPDEKLSVIFTEVKPFSPTESRVLLVMLVDKVGSPLSKRSRNGAVDSGPSDAEVDRLRRPLAAACVDITKDLLPTLLPFRTTTRSFERHSKNPMCYTPRVLSIRHSAETCHADILMKLANETRSSVWDMLPIEGAPACASNSQLGGGTSWSDGLEDITIEIKDVKALDMQPYHIVRREYPGSVVARPYGSIEGNFSSTETIRNDFFVTIKSAFFEKMVSRKEYNVEIEASIRDASGRPLPWLENTTDMKYMSTICVSRSQPRWNELVRFSLPWSTTTGVGSSGNGRKRLPDRFSRLEGFLEGSTTPGDHIEPMISSTSSRRSSGDSDNSSSINPTTAHLRFVIRHRSIISGNSRFRWLRSPSPSFGRDVKPLYDSDVVGGSLNRSGPLHWLRSHSPQPFHHHRQEGRRSSMESPFEPRDRVLGVAFLPLGSLKEPAFAKDGDYSLFIYKMDAQEIAECKYLSKESTAYLDAGSFTSSGSSGSNKYSVLGKSDSLSARPFLTTSLLTTKVGRNSKQPDLLSISTLLCSNQYTTDEHLAKILSWRENMEDIVLCLQCLISHADKEGELKKFRIQLVDCLLQILSINEATGSATHLEEMHRFTVALLARIYRELNNNAAASELFEQYLQSPIFVYSGLHISYLQVFIHLLTRNLNAANPESPSAELGPIDINKICTTFFWAFKVIAASRGLEVKELKMESSEVQINSEKRFIDAVDKFFDVVLQVATNGGDQLLKSHIFKHISELIDSLAQVYPQDRLTASLERLVHCTIQCPNLPNHNILSGCLRSILMNDPRSRRVLVPPIISNLKSLFSANLDITLKPCRSETNSMMTYFCNILILFMDRFVETVLSSSPTTTTTSPSSKHEDASHPEFHELFVRQGFLRWVMREYSRILISLQRTASATANSRPASSELAPTTTTTTTTSSQSPINTQTPAKARFLYFQPVLGCLASVFTSILQQLRPNDWVALLAPKQQPRLNCTCATCLGLEMTDTADFVHELLYVFLLSHFWPAYPGLHSTDRPFKYHNWPTHLVTPLTMETTSREQPWVEMLALQSTVELDTLRVLFEVCIQPLFLSNNCAGKLDAGHDRSRLLVALLQRCLGSFITMQPHLWLEELPTVTMVATAPRLPDGCLGDLRVSAGQLLEEIWRAISPRHQTQYIEYFVPTVINASTEPVSELRRICVALLADMLSVNPLRAEPYLIREVDRVMNWALPEYSTEMLSLLEAELPAGETGSLSRHSLGAALRRSSAIRPPATPAGGVAALATGTALSSTVAEKAKVRILCDLIRQMNYLREYSEVMTRPSKLTGMLVINHLRAYYDSIKLKDMTIRYLFKLEELHGESENDLERGYTLERISSQYSWSSKAVDISEVSSRYASVAKTSSMLKEALLKDALKYLKAGGDWKRTIDVCDQLIVFYRDVIADLNGLSDILAEQSQLYKTFISGEARNQCCFKYYALHFYTHEDAPGFIGSTVVYRTLSQLNEVKMILREQFPEYHVETNNPHPLTSASTQVTEDVPTIRLVGNLQPVPELPPNWASGEASANLSPYIKAYYEWNQVRQFTRTYHYKPSKSKDGKEMPVAEEVCYILRDKLPNIVCFMPVEEIRKRTLSKAELSISMVQDMSRQLSSMMAEINSSANGSALFSNFLSKLSASIHSPVSGGLTALLTGVNLTDDSLDERQSEQLSDSIFQLLEVQLEGITLCQRKEVPPEVAASVSSLLPTMIEQYHSLMHDMSMKFGISVAPLLERMQSGSPRLCSSLGCSSATYGLNRVDKVYRRATDLPTPPQHLRPRGTFQQDLKFLDDDSFDSQLSPSEHQNASQYQRMVSQVLPLPQTPPALPERPSDLPSLTAAAAGAEERVRRFSLGGVGSSTGGGGPRLPSVVATPNRPRPVAPLPPVGTVDPVAAVLDEVAQPLPPKPPKPPPRAPVNPVT